MAAGGGDVGVPPFGGRDEVFWDIGHLYVHLQAIEYGGAVNHYAPYSGPMSGYG